MATSERLLRVLDLFTLEDPDWSVEEAASELAFATSTTYRYFASLAAAGLLASFGSGRYVIGPAVTRYDRQLRLTDPLIAAARLEMERVAAFVAARSVVLLCRHYGDDVMCVHQTSLHGPAFGLSYERGRPMPLFAGSASKAILAHLPARRVHALFKRFPEKFAATGLGEDLDSVRANLRALRVRGYQVSSGEIDKGMRGISVPLLESTSVVIGSLSIVGPRAGLKQHALAGMVTELKRAAIAIEGELHRAAQRNGRSARP